MCLSENKGYLIVFDLEIRTVSASVSWKIKRIERIILELEEGDER